MFQLWLPTLQQSQTLVVLNWHEAEGIRKLHVLFALHPFPPPHFPTSLDQLDRLILIFHIASMPVYTYLNSQCITIYHHKLKRELKDSLHSRGDTAFLKAKKDLYSSEN